MMDACGTDYESRRDYCVAHAFIQKMHKGFKIGMQSVFGPKDYARERRELKEKLISEGEFEGLSPEKIDDMVDNRVFKNLTDAACTYGFFPIYADANDGNNYVFFNKSSLIELIKEQAKGNVTEINFNAKVVASAYEQMPSLAPIDRPKIENDGILIELPSAIECKVCHRHFDSQLDFSVHFNQHIKSGGGEHED